MACGRFLRTSPASAPWFSSQSRGSQIPADTGWRFIATRASARNFSTGHSGKEQQDWPSTGPRITGRASTACPASKPSLIARKAEPDSRTSGLPRDRLTGRENAWPELGKAAMRGLGLWLGWFGKSQRMTGKKNRHGGRRYGRRYDRFPMSHGGAGTGSRGPRSGAIQKQFARLLRSVRLWRFAREPVPPPSRPRPFPSPISGRNA